MPNAQDLQTELNAVITARQTADTTGPALTAAQQADADAKTALSTSLTKFQADLAAFAAGSPAPANALSGLDALKYLALVKKWEPAVEAYVTEGNALVRSILIDAGYLTPTQHGLFGGGNFINLILSNLPAILAIVEKFTAVAGGTAPPPA